MGCDIHLHIEVKIAGVWHHYSHPYVRRNYKLFELMAGVRGNIANAIAAPKGLPKDITELTRYNASVVWRNSGHSHSWLSAEEIAKLEDRWVSSHPQFEDDLEHYIFNCYLFRDSFAGFHKYPTERPTNLEDVRFIFWFDS